MRYWGASSMLAGQQKGSLWVRWEKGGAIEWRHIRRGGELSSSVSQLVSFVGQHRRTWTVQTLPLQRADSINNRRAGTWVA
jgi:hypothetical protein